MSAAISMALPVHIMYYFKHSLLRHCGSALRKVQHNVNIGRLLSASATGHRLQTAVYNKLLPDDYLEASDKDTKSIVANSMHIYNDFLTEEEEKSVLDEIEPYLQRMRYEYDHWDNAIHGYRETERNRWRERNKAIIQRVRDVAFPPGVPQLQLVHILDIAKEGYIKPHVDSVRFCGNTIAGISLLSSAVMRLVKEENKDCCANILLKRRSLYIMSGDARYKFAHELLPEETSLFKGQVIPRDRRISVICRNEPIEDDEKSK